MQLYFIFHFIIIIIIISVNGLDNINKLVEQIKSTQYETQDLVNKWATEIGEILTDLSVSMTREKKVKESFESLRNNLYEISGSTLAAKTASDLRYFMEKKNKAVQKIAEYAEFLSYYRNDDETYKNETRDKYFYYNVDEIVDTEVSPLRIQEMEEYIILLECKWWCTQKGAKPLSYNLFDQTHLHKLFEKRQAFENAEHSCDCEYLINKLPKEDTFFSLPMKYDSHFGTKVNINISALKIATNIFERDVSILEGIRWSESLDLVFKENYYNDPELIWQYFASPTGFMRHYPAIQWKQERYYQTYDFRARSWYTEAVTSPKNIMILVDRSGSMRGIKRKLSHQIVNDILDTLNDNDFVNIYTFNNVTRPLVNCFNDTLFQANEENLRLLREYLPVYMPEFAADIYIALKKAFQILDEHSRPSSMSAKCNQAIMLITEGIDYEYDISIFKVNNWDKNFPVRIFTYLLSTEKEDEKQMEFIACTNRGYYVNMTTKPDVREKILKYLNVMSRPINSRYDKKQVAIWSYLHVDLADRRLSNWLWTKFAGIRQREVFLDHAKRRIERLQLSYNSFSHMLLQESHEYEKYEEKENYNYMTTVSLPVYGRRENEYELIGVAGVDVPIKYFRNKIPHDVIGVNGYAFIITNNGYVLMHPEHRTEFEYILKPTFNRVDILETEILDDTNEPRIFGADIVRLRKRMLLQNSDGHSTLKIKYTLDDMKRIIRATRHYYYTKIGPFTLCVVLPDKYGHIRVNRSDLDEENRPFRFLTKSLSGKWAVHPDWIYCKNCPSFLKSPTEKAEHAYYEKSHRTDLFYDFLYDMDHTSWFDDKIPDKNNYIEDYYIHKTFIATASGLTRWKISNHEMYQNIYGEVEPANDRSIDEDWYQRAVEENYKNENMSIYSVPFEISGYENNTKIRTTKAIFIEKDNKKTPIAVVGMEFNHQKMYKLYYNIISKPRGRKGDKNITCGTHLDCFILDNNGYILLSNETEYTGRFIGDIRPDIMSSLVEENVFETTKMFDYQATCQVEPPKAPKNRKCFDKGSAKRIFNTPWILENLLGIFKYLLHTLLFLIKYSHSEDIIKSETKTFEALEINKTVPTPCDREMWLYTLKDKFRTTSYDSDLLKFNCNWPYVVQKIPNSNLVFLAINRRCPEESSNSAGSVEPREIIYYDKNLRMSLPCYIALKNNYTRFAYMTCYSRDEREAKLNENDKRFCGHTWK